MWQKAKAMAVDVYRVSESLPKAEMYGLTSQVRRAAVSVASNIAEGQGRLTKGEFGHFLGQARGSLLELETQLEIALDLGFVSQPEFDRLCELFRGTQIAQPSYRLCTGKQQISTKVARNLKLET